MTRLVITIVSILYPLLLSSQCVGTSGQVSWHIWEDDTPYWGMHSLFSDDTFGGAPDKIRALSATSTIQDYDNDYGSIMKGFIVPNQTGSYQFNITGDDLIVFFLSDDASFPDYSDTTAVSNRWTEPFAHNDTTTQTSASKHLVSGQEYYFELYHREGSGGDHVNLFWDLPGGMAANWQLITSPFLADICDPLCATKGTPCNDSNPSTADDIEDGYCNCVGTPNPGSLAVGSRGMINTYVYDNIPSAPLSNLYNHADYPGAPSRMFYYNQGLYADWDDDMKETGVLMKGFLTVPADGDYDFNITGVGETTFRLNTTANAVGITDSIFSNRWWMDVYDHDNDVQGGDQSLSNVSLLKNQYYYFELIHKNPDYGNRFMIFWNGPQHSDDGWYRIAPELVYNYEDPLLCAPEGSSCDDGNPLTANDEIDSNCDCVGTPCDPMEDCDDPEANYVKYDYCETTDQLLPTSHDSWLSCSAQPHPYIDAYQGSNYHWIHYDLGDQYLLGQTHIWNYNVPDSTQYGFINVAVHYSLDGTDWDLMGEYSWTPATGNGNYSGFAGPDFGNLSARYVVFTSLDTDLSCRGISKITFEANYCQEKGTSCDDGDMITYNDHYDDLCQCIGYTLEELDCVLDTLYINQDDLSPNEYHAIMALMSEGKVMHESSVNYKAGLEIVLNAGFEVDLGSSFEASISDCPAPSLAMIDSKSDETYLKRKERPKESLQVFNLEGSDIQTIRFYLPQPTQVAISLYDESGSLIVPIVNHHYENYGDQYKRIQTRKLDPGIYTVRMDTPNGSILEKMIVLGIQ